MLPAAEAGWMRASLGRYLPQAAGVLRRGEEDTRATMDQEEDRGQGDQGVQDSTTPPPEVEEGVQEAPQGEAPEGEAPEVAPEEEKEG